MRKITKPIDRFFRHVEPEPNTGCWLWSGASNSSTGGYGHFNVGPTRIHRDMLAHRFSYESFVGPLVAGLTIDHLCRVRSCVNPAHLDQVPIGVNSSRSPLSESAKTRCPLGHPYTFKEPNGARRCRQCRRAKAQRAYWRSKSARTDGQTVTPGPAE